MNESLELATLQVKAANKVVEELSAIPTAEAIDSLADLVKMKEKALSSICEHLQRVCTLTHHGISGASVSVIANGYLQAIRTASAQLSVFSQALATLTHNEDIAIAYAHISERVEREVTNLLTEYQEEEKEVIAQPEEADFIEVYKVYNQFNL